MTRRDSIFSDPFFRSRMRRKKDHYEISARDFNHYPTKTLEIAARSDKPVVITKRGRPVGMIGGQSTCRQVLPDLSLNEEPDD